MQTGDTGSSISLADQLNPNLWDSVPNNSPVALPNSSTPVVAAALQPQNPAGDPTSNGDIAAIQSVQQNFNQAGGFTPPQDAAAALAAVSGPIAPLTAEQRQIASLATLSTTSQTMAPKDA